jgi:hypothetical protein
MMNKDTPPCMIFVNREGKWFHKGVEMIHRGIIQDFYRNIQNDGYGNYVLTLGGEKCYLEVEDTPFIVTRAEFEVREKNDENISIFLTDDTVEKLDPSTLKVGKDNVLYCSIKGNTFKARFGRAAYYQIAEYIKEEGGKYYLPLNNHMYYL